MYTAELMTFPASAPQLVYQRLWYVPPCLCSSAYERAGHCVPVTGFYLVLTSINVHHSPTSIMIPNKGLKVAHKECENSYIVFAQFSDKLPWRKKYDIYIYTIFQNKLKYLIQSLTPDVRLTVPHKIVSRGLAGYTLIIETYIYIYVQIHGVSS